MIGHGAAALAVARKEFLEHVRTKRLLIVGVFFFLAMLLGLSIGLRVVEEQPATSDRVVLVLAFYFGGFPVIGGIGFTSALGIIMSADAIVGEWKDRSLFLLLSKPVSRAAVLGGKILGAFLSVFSVFTLVFALGLAIVIGRVGAPDGATWGQILGGFSLVALGILPFVAFGIFCSTLFRTPAGSFLVAFGAWFLGFPILGNLGLIIRLFQRRFEAAVGDDGLIQFFHYFDPKWLMEQGAGVLLGGRTLSFFTPGTAETNVPLVVFAMGLHALVFLGMSFWIVRRRDYA